MNALVVSAVVLVLVCVMSISSVVVEKFIVEPIFRPDTRIIDPIFDKSVPSVNRQGIVEPIFRKKMPRHSIVEPIF
jgi:hypothetical protein